MRRPDSNRSVKPDGRRSTASNAPTLIHTPLQSRFGRERDDVRAKGERVAAQLPEELRTLLSRSDAEELTTRVDLPCATPAQEEAWREFVTLATACAVGCERTRDSHVDDIRTRRDFHALAELQSRRESRVCPRSRTHLHSPTSPHECTSRALAVTVRLTDSIGAHARAAYVADLATRFATAESLVPWAEAGCAQSLAGGLSESERREAFEAHAAALRACAAAREPAAAPSDNALRELLRNASVSGSGDA